MHSLSRTLRTMFPLVDFVYILQQEDYRLDRYMLWLRRFFFRRNITIRNDVVWTPRALLLFATATVIHLAYIATGYAIVGQHPLAIALCLTSFFLIPLFVACAHVLTLPLFSFARMYAWHRAAATLHARPDLRIVLIVGSFGKTTTRTYVYECLKHTYTIATPPGNINTETGVAQWITRAVSPRITLLLLEADAYAQGEIARMCTIARPHIAVITALGDQHMERLKSKEHLVAATQEAFEHAHDTAVCVARDDVWDTLTAHGYRYDGKTIVDADCVPHTYASLEQVLVSLPFTHRAAALLAIAVAHACAVPERFVHHALTTTHAPSRRQEITRIGAYEGMDDSYNISFTTAYTALTAARNEAHRLRKKLLVVVAGIPEAGIHSGDNTRLALACLEIADHTVVIESMFTHHFRAVFAKEKEKITFVTSVNNSCIAALPSQFHPDEWFLLLFNELGDMYH